MFYIESVNRIRAVVSHSHEAKASEALKKAARPKGILFPVGMFANLTKSLYHNLRHLGELVAGTNLDEAGAARIQWNLFFSKLRQKYNFSEVDWNTFPNPPEEYPWFLNPEEWE